MRFRISGHQAKNVNKISSDNRIAAHSHASGLADAKRCELADGLVSERSAAGNHAYMTLPVNAARHNSHFAFSRRDHAWTVRPYEPGLSSHQELLNADHIEGWNAFGDCDYQGHARIGCFHDGVGGKRRRYEDHRDVCSR